MLLDLAHKSVSQSMEDQNLRASVIRKKRSIGMIPSSMDALIPREGLDETVLRVQDELSNCKAKKITLPFCAFNGGRDGEFVCVCV